MLLMISGMDLSHNSIEMHCLFYGKSSLPLMCAASRAVKPSAWLASLNVKRRIAPPSACFCGSMYMFFFAFSQLQMGSTCPSLLLNDLFCGVH